MIYNQDFNSQVMANHAVKPLGRALVHYDVLVVGGGPSGSAFVRCLADQMQRSVLHIDAAAFPRDKICGDLLSYSSLPIIKALFPRTHRHLQDRPLIQSAAYTYNDSRKTFASLPDNLVVTRFELDHLLWDESCGERVTKMDATRLSALKMDGDLVRATLMREQQTIEVTASLIVGADGSMSTVRKHLGYDMKSQVGFAARRYLQTEGSDRSTIHMHFDEEHDGYFWLFPLSKTDDHLTTFNAGYFNRSSRALITPRFDYYLELDEIKALLGHVVSESPTLTYPLRYWDLSSGVLTFKERILGKNFCLVGDAAGMIHPYSGEGISFGMISAIAAHSAYFCSGKEDQEACTLYESILRETLFPSVTNIGFLGAKSQSLLKQLIAQAGYQYG